MDKGDNIDQVSQLVQARDPVNIGMNKYGRFEMKGAPKARSYVEQFKDGLKLPPNIAIFCTTPMKIPQQSFVDNDAIFFNVHVINAIAFAFDNLKQPDAQYFCEPKRRVIKESKREEYKQHVNQVVRKIFACAENKKIERLVLSMIGCGAFAGDKENKTIVKDTLLEAYATEIQNWKGNELQIYMLGKEGHDEEIVSRLSEACEKIGTAKCYFHSRIGLPPIIIPNSIGIIGYKNTLYVNAWDPHSAVGNGNGADNSLDGFFGRASAMAPLCHPFTNKRLRNISPDVYKQV